MRYSQLIDTIRNNAARLLLAACCVLLFSQVSARKSRYKKLKPATGDVTCIKDFAPHFTNTLYSATVDVTKHHFSGILFFKYMPDSSTRVVFTNEMGVKFFDFAFAPGGGFTKYYVMSKLDKKVVVKALRKDLELVIMHQDISQAVLMKDSVYNYTAIPNKKGNDYYITDHCTRLVRIEKASKTKPVVEVQMLNYISGVPDSISIVHKNFTFNIFLKRVEKESE